jgi:hypothetical protein
MWPRKWILLTLLVVASSVTACSSSCANTPKSYSTGCDALAPNRSFTGWPALDEPLRYGDNGP